MPKDGSNLRILPAPSFVSAPGVELAVVPLGEEPAGGDEAGEGAPKGRLAAIDIGSNSIHMIVVAPDPPPGRGYRVVAKEKEMVRLGRSALGDGALSTGAIRRGLEALVKMTELARLKGARRAVAVATSAVREAANGQEFLERVRAQTGLAVTLLSGEEEGRLIHRAVREVADLSEGTSLIIDIGGGSTEWIASRDGDPSAVISLPLGSLRCAATLGSGDPPSAKKIDKLRRQIGAVLANLPPEARFAADDADRGPRRVICTSGTALAATALADLLVERASKPPTSTLREVRAKELRVVVRHLAGLDRRSIARLGPVGGEARAESILAGTVLLDELLRFAGAARYEVCDRALREGLVLAALDRPVVKKGEDRRRRQVMRLARRAEATFAHGVECARIAVRLFDRTVSLHGLGARQREWLEYAALLHDVGYSINYRGHQKHSYYLITNAGLDAFDPAEVEIIALLARYHRGKRPKADRPDLAPLPRWQRQAVIQLTALLRLADSLDRTHASRVRDLFCSIGKKKVEVEVISPYDVDLELEAARSVAKLFQRTFGKGLKVRQGLQPRQGGAGV